MTAAADPATGAPTNGAGGTVLAFLNEVAGGRKLLEAVRERVEPASTRSRSSRRRTSPSPGQIVDRDEVREAALSRVEVTQAVLHEFGIDSAGAIMDPDPALALDDAIRAFTPREVLLSCLYGTRFGFTRKDLVEWAKQTFEVPITHIPVRIEDDAIRWDVTHTLVVATRTVASSGLVARLKSRAADHPQRYTIVSPPSGGITREEICDRLARTLAEMYRADIDATGQPMSPAPLARDQERTRALPDRRDPDLHPRRREVQVARGGADRQRAERDRQARRARGGRRRRRPAVVDSCPPPSQCRGGRGGARLMESASIAATGEHEHHGPPEAHASSRIDRQTLGILLFIVSEVMLFGSFFAAYFFIRVVANVGPWPPDGAHAPGRRWPASTPRSWSPRASRSTGRSSRSAARTGAGCTWAWRPPSCWARPSSSSRSTSTSTSASSAHTDAFGSIFYGLTGLHGAHVTVGLILLGLRQHPRLARPLLEGPKKHLGVEVPGIYWHFVDVMWIIVFTTVYIL